MNPAIDLSDSLPLAYPELLLVVFALAAAGFGMLYTRAIEPALQAEKTAKAP